MTAGPLGPFSVVVDTSTLRRFALSNHLSLLAIAFGAPILIPFDVLDPRDLDNLFTPEPPASELSELGRGLYAFLFQRDPYDPAYARAIQSYYTLYRHIHLGAIRCLPPTHAQMLTLDGLQQGRYKGRRFKPLRGRGDLACIGMCLMDPSLALASDDRDMHRVLQILRPGQTRFHSDDIIDLAVRRGALSRTDGLAVSDEVQACHGRIRGTVAPWTVREKRLFYIIPTSSTG